MQGPRKNSSYWGGFNVPATEWVYEAGPAVNFGDQLMQMVQKNGMVQHVAQTTRWRFSQVSPVLDLMLARTSKDIGSCNLEELQCNGDYAATCLFAETVSPQTF